MNKTLPKGWKMFKFKDIGIRISEKVVPGETDLDRYVGLEHLDSESLKIKRWGSPSDVIGEKLRVRPGEVIFGKRRAYQRKLAIAEFDCICSAHAMVLKANENNVRKDFFPFFLQSDLFMERALEISVGSLSPTINWGTLKNQEFPLPPLVEQKRIAEVLWVVENSVWKTEDAIGVAERYKRTLMKHLFMYGPVSSRKSKQMKMRETPIGPIPYDWDVQPMGELGQFSKGKGISKKDYLSEGIPCITYGEIYTTHDTIIREFRTYISKTVAQKSTEIHNGDLLFTGSGETADEIGKTVAYLRDAVACAGGDVIIFTPSKMNSTYLTYYLNSVEGLKQKSRYGQGFAIVHIYPHHLRKILIPIPSKREQDIITQVLETYYLYVSNSRIELNTLRELKNHLIDYLLLPLEKHR